MRKNPLVQRSNDPAARGLGTREKLPRFMIRGSLRTSHLVPVQEDLKRMTKMFLIDVLSQVLPYVSKS